MAVDLQISDLPSKSSLVSTDQFGVDDNTRVTWKVTAAQVLTFINANAQIAESQVTNLTTDLANRLIKTNNLSDVSSITTSFNNVSPLSAKGDLIVYSGTNNVRLPVGTNSFVLTANSSATNGVNWAASPSGITPQYSAWALAGATTSNGLIVWDTIITDPAGMNGSGTIEPTLPGWYLMYAEIGPLTANGNLVTLTIHGNNVANTDASASMVISPGSNRFSISAQGLFFCNGSGDYVQVSWTSTQTTTIGGNAAFNRYNITRISAS